MSDVIDTPKGLKLYSIHDDKSGVFSAPFVSYNDHTAKREFASLVNDESSFISKHSGDYTLYKIAYWDDCNGIVHQSSALICLGSELKNID